jgi:hypothetical protein
MLRSALRFFAGAALGLIVWWYGTPAYNAALAKAATIIRVDHRFADARITPVGRAVEVFPPGAPSRSLPADQLTYNIILLAGLFATNRRFFRDRNMRNFAIAIGVLVLSHWLALITTIQADYAQRLGDWSEQHYGNIERFIWAECEYFYRLVGMFGIAFACWWISSAESAPAAGRSRGSRKPPAPR